eukprot:GEMP01013108.1.p1 GENE.GEMP01013108.1~~GEMP01013108.1.p1  ORF type:complete len:297 (+),score=45.67 GEMP01013108.1:40-930(+)
MRYFVQSSCPTQGVEFIAPDVRVGKRRASVVGSDASWFRRLNPGLMYSGCCPNKKCISHIYKYGLVVCERGFGTFRPNEDSAFRKIRCPACKSLFEPECYIIYKASAKICFSIVGQVSEILQISQSKEGEYLRLGEPGKKITYTSLIIDCQDVGVYEEQNVPLKYKSSLDDVVNIMNNLSLDSSDAPDPTSRTKANEMDPAVIRYTQDSIAFLFRCHRSVRDTMCQLRDKSICPAVIPSIQVFEWEGRIHSSDNRRLWAFKKANVKSIPVIWITFPMVDRRKFTTEDEGISIVFRE